MEPSDKKFNTVDEYHASFPKSTRDILDKLRKTIKEAAPEAEETISYNMPAYKLNGALMYYAAWKEHIGVYGTTGISAFEKELSDYEISKGTIKFPLNKPLPLKLIAEIVKFRVKENQLKIKKKKK